MDNTNFSNLINILSKTPIDATNGNIPKEVLDQYPYGDFPLRYTKTGQEFLRKNSEARYLNPSPNPEANKSSEPDMSTLVSILSLLGGKKKSSNDIFELLSSILFKDNPELKNILKLFNPKKQTEIETCSDFPDANKVKISNLKRVE